MYIFFTAVTESVMMGKDGDDSTEKIDKEYGCSYRPLYCSGCESMIGKMYTSTHEEFDDMRNAYTFKTEKLTNYSLGSVNSANLGVMTVKDELENKMAELENKMAQVEQLVMTLSEKMAVLEERMHDREEPRQKKTFMVRQTVVKSKRVSVVEQVVEDGAQRGRKKARIEESDDISPVASPKRGIKKARVDVPDDPVMSPKHGRKEALVGDSDDESWYKSNGNKPVHLF
ncbi:MIS18A [Branchiostoma lanceolatum]|uniref:MIS18A protein n=1 Tax=Branchiostoma lanceolatum TaxID=7740 RepID=A0A8J9ZEK3_BRALA|nr:MIS18A [Branchiostoma lanceolatum]